MGMCTTKAWSTGDYTQTETKYLIRVIIHCTSRCQQKASPLLSLLCCLPSDWLLLGKTSLLEIGSQSKMTTYDCDNWHDKYKMGFSLRYELYFEEEICILEQILYTFSIQQLYGLVKCSQPLPSHDASFTVYTWHICKWRVRAHVTCRSRVHIVVFTERTSHYIIYFLIIGVNLRTNRETSHHQLYTNEDSCSSHVRTERHIIHQCSESSFHISVLHTM